MREDFSFDQLDLRVNSKLLLAKLEMSPCKVERYLQKIETWWYLSTSMDGITFSASKKIKLAGVGIFGSHENKTLSCNIKIIEGTPTSLGNFLIDDITDAPPASDATNNITPYYFKKPITIKQGMQYTAQICIINDSNNYAYTYYGTNGSPLVEGEKKVDFTFTYVEGYSSSVECGIFPEFYYLC